MWAGTVIFSIGFAGRLASSRLPSGIQISLPYGSLWRGRDKETGSDASDRY